MIATAPCRARGPKGPNEVDQARVTLFPVFGTLPLLFGVEAEERGGQGAGQVPATSRPRDWTGTTLTRSHAVVRGEVPRPAHTS